MIHRSSPQPVVWILVLWILALLLLLSVTLLTATPAIATISTIEEAPGQALYRSQTSLQDQTGKIWQVILFKQLQPDQRQSLSLRLVGLPGAAEVTHPKALSILSGMGQTLQAPDVLGAEAPVPTVGQYGMQGIVTQLALDDVVLGIPLAGNEWVTLPVPRSVVREWQTLAAQPS
jgi:hypothetical protein